MTQIPIFSLRKIQLINASDKHSCPAWNTSTWNLLHCINSRRICTLLDIAIHKSILLRLAHSCPHKIRIIAVFILLWKLTSYRINNKRSPGKQRIYLLGHISGDKISTAKNLIFVMFANSSLRNKWSSTYTCLLQLFKRILISFYKKKLRLYCVTHLCGTMFVLQCTGIFPRWNANFIT